MAKVKFNIDIVDADSQFRYTASSEFVEVSENFANRLRKANADVVFDGEDTGLSAGDGFSKEEIIAKCEAHIEEIEAGHLEDVKTLEAEITQLKEQAEKYVQEIDELKQLLADVDKEEIPNAPVTAEAPKTEDKSKK